MKNRTDLLIKISFVFVVGDGTVGEEEETVWYLQCPLGSENNGIWGTEFPASEDITWPTCNIQHCVEIPSLQGRVSVQGVESLGGHFAILCRGFDFYEVKKILLFSKNKREILSQF